MKRGGKGVGAGAAAVLMAVLLVERRGGEPAQNW
jgi:hypothetical protein